MLDQKFSDLVSLFLDGALEPLEIQALRDELRTNARRQPIFRQHLLVHAALCRRLGNENVCRAAIALSKVDFSTLSSRDLEAYLAGLGPLAAQPVAVKGNSPAPKMVAPRPASHGGGATVVSMPPSSSRFLRFGLGLATAASVAVMGYVLLQTEEASQPVSNEARPELGVVTAAPPAANRDSFLGLGNLRDRESRPVVAADARGVPAHPTRPANRLATVDVVEWEEEAPVFATLDTELSDPLEGNPFDPKVLREQSKGSSLDGFLLISSEGSEPPAMSLRLKP